MSARRRIAIVTGTRAEYGLLRSTIEAIHAHPRLKPQIVVTGMHLLGKFGRTIRTIENDGWPIDARVPMQRGADNGLDQARGVARGVSGMAAFFHRADTEVVLVLGDRIEAMAGALAGVTTGRFVAHVHGGDVAAGDVDDSLRHSITKLAHVHLAATEQAARRIVRLGERRAQVHVVGAPGLDRLRALVTTDPPLPAPRRERRAIVVQHPYGRRAARERATMDNVLRAVRHHDLRPLIIYPNSDRGHEGIIAAIQRAARRATDGPAQVRRSVPRDEYLRLLMSARVLVGNSSSGILEASLAGTPAVNIGPRQRGRQRAGRAVIDCDESYAAICDAIKSALRRRPRILAASPYGDGHAGARIARILAGVKLSDSLRCKRITY